jgi:nucleoside-diphosphate-sugar epimerase
MVIGNGSIAKVFKQEFENDDSVIIFASGVSNSNEKNLSEYQRETILLKNTLTKFPEKKIVYFSSISSKYVNSEYFNHKELMENLIIKNSNNFIIIRLPQIISNSGNQNNLINFLVNSIRNNHSLEIQKDVCRALIDVDDLKKVTLEVIKNFKNKIFNFSKIESLTVVNLCEMIFEILNSKVEIIEIIPKFNTPNLENSPEIDNILEHLIDKKNYTNKILKKYLTNGNSNRFL